MTLKHCLPGDDFLIAVIHCQHFIDKEEGRPWTVRRNHRLGTAYWGGIQNCIFLLWEHVPQTQLHPFWMEFMMWVLDGLDLSQVLHGVVFVCVDTLNRVVIVWLGCSRVALSHDAIVNLHFFTCILMGRECTQGWLFTTIDFFFCWVFWPCDPSRLVCGKTHCTDVSKFRWVQSPLIHHRK